MEMRHEILSRISGEKGIVEVHLGNPGESPQDDVLDAGLGGCGHGDRVPVATQARGYPKDVYFRDGRRGVIRETSRSHDENGFPSMRNQRRVENWTGSFWASNPN